MSAVVSTPLPSWSDVYWCHSCETFQRGADKRTGVWMPWANARMAACGFCDDSWDFGVFDIPMEFGDNGRQQCWRAHARDNDCVYPCGADCGKR